MKETSSQAVKELTRVFIFLIGLLSIIGITYTFGWEFLGHPRGVVIILFSICAIVWAIKGGVSSK